MDVHETEEQQVEALKKWWQENRSSIITGILLGLAILFGGKSWLAYQKAQAESASNIYAGMMAALSRDAATVVAERAGILTADYPDTTYAMLAALALAKLKVDEQDYAAAATQLQWALDHADTDLLRQIVQLRLARVRMAAGDLDAAAALLATVTPAAAFEPLYAELRGDLLLAQGNAAGAREAYALALAALTPDAPGYRIVKLKHDDLPPPEAAGATP